MTRLTREPQIMRRKSIAGIQIALILLSLGYLDASAFAQRPNFVKQLFQKRDASAKEMELQDKHGPWLVLAATFYGETAQAAAVSYAKEIRDKLKVPAFIMQQNENSEELIAVGQRIVTDEFGRQVPKQVAAKFANKTSDNSVAVLVGEFHSKDDPQIDILLQKVRNFEPSSKNPDSKDRVTTSFLTRNPLLPDDFFQTPKVDRFVEELNRQDWIRHSLLECPGRFTVRVATFRGPDVVTVASKAKLNTENPTTALDKAASQANKMTIALRARGVEAYEFHDRYGSYVMIGSFDSLGNETPNGEFHYDPRIIAILQQYCGYREVIAKDPKTGAASRTMSLNSEGRIPFDVEGKPIAVPRPDTSRIYSGSLFK